MSRSDDPNPNSFNVTQTSPANRPPRRDALADAMNAYAPRRRSIAPIDSSQLAQAHPVRDLYVPITLLAIGAITWFGLGLFAPLYPERGVLISLAVILTGFIVNLALLLAGVYLAALALSINFGSLSTVLLKLAAMGTFAGAIFMIFARLDMHSMRGPIMGWHAVVILYWIFFAKLFELETQETLLTVAIVAFTQAAGACIVLQF